MYSAFGGSYKIMAWFLSPSLGAIGKTIAPKHQTTTYTRNVSAHGRQY